MTMAKFQVGDRVTAARSVLYPDEYRVVPSESGDRYPVRTLSNDGFSGLWLEDELRLVSRKEMRERVVTPEELLPGDVITTGVAYGYVKIVREVETVPQYPAEPKGNVFVTIKARKNTATGNIMVGKFNSAWCTFTYRDGCQFQGSWDEVCEHFDVESIRSIYKEEK